MNDLTDNSVDRQPVSKHKEKHRCDSSLPGQFHEGEHGAKSRVGASVFATPALRAEPHALSNRVETRAEALAAAFGNGAHEQNQPVVANRGTGGGRPMPMPKFTSPAPI